MYRRVQDSTGLEKGPLAVCYRQGNEYLGAMKMEMIFSKGWSLYYTPLMFCRRVAQQEPCCARWFLIQCIQSTQRHMWVARPHGIHAVLNGGMNAHVWRWHGLFCSSATLVSLRADEYIHQPGVCNGVCWRWEDCCGIPREGTCEGDQDYWRSYSWMSANNPKWWLTDWQIPSGEAKRRLAG